MRIPNQVSGKNDPKRQLPQAKNSDHHQPPGAPARAGAGGSRAGEGAAQAVEIRLRFNARQLRDLTRCAAYDHAATPGDWVKVNALGLIPDTLEAIRREGLTPEQRQAEDERIARIAKSLVPSSDPMFTPDETRAIACCAKWEATDFREFVRAATFALVVGDFEEITYDKDGGHCDPRTNRNEARRFHKALAPIMAAIPPGSLPALVPDYNRGGQ